MSSLPILTRTRQREMFSLVGNQRVDSLKSFYKQGVLLWNNKIWHYMYIDNVEFSVIKLINKICQQRFMKIK